MLDFLLCLIAEQMIQTEYSEQEMKWKSVISELDTKVNKSHELYYFCVDLLQKWGVPLSKGICWFGSPLRTDLILFSKYVPQRIGFIQQGLLPELFCW
jgi:hypothetical protein